MSVTSSIVNPRIFGSVGNEDNVLPLNSYLDAPLTSLENAVKLVASQISYLNENVTYALDQCASPRNDLTQDQSASIYLYTMEEPQIYRRLNSTIMDRDRSKLKPWFSYMKLLRTALERLPVTATIIARGVSRDVTANSTLYRNGKTIRWWCVTSCTTNLEVAERFAKQLGAKSTFFIIRCINGRKVSKHSSFPDESEIILMPGTCLRVTSDPIVDEDDGMRIIHLQEIPAESSSPKPVPSIQQNTPSPIQNNSSTKKVTQTYSNGNTYCGEMFNGQKHGRGTFRWTNGDHYDGEWKEDVRTGYGVYKWSNGDVYKGDWLAGNMEGKGVKKYADGGSYDGMWKNDNFHGSGIRKWADGNKYEGDWVNDKRIGRGILTWASGDRYDGEWKEDARTGYGVYKWPKGDVYKGNWIAGKMKGKGVKTYADGGSYDGYWDNDNFHGYGIREWADGNKYEGDWMKGKRTGHGIFTWTDGDRYDGEWKEDKRHGTGIWRRSDGAKERQVWEEDRVHFKTIIQK